MQSFNYKHLTSSEKDERIKNLHGVVRKKEREIQLLRKKVGDMLQEEAVTVDDMMHNDLLTIMKTQQLMLVNEKQRNFFGNSS